MPDITAKLADHRDEVYRDFAVLHDLDAKMLNRVERRNRGNDPYPFEVSGDALALYKARH